MDDIVRRRSRRRNMIYSGVPEEIGIVIFLLHMMYDLRIGTDRPFKFARSRNSLLLGSRDYVLRIRGKR